MGELRGVRCRTIVCSSVVRVHVSLKVVVYDGEVLIQQCVFTTGLVWNNANVSPCSHSIALLRSASFPVHQVRHAQRL
jgi:hypothetical protein